MGVIKTPYSIDEIRKHPYPVVISLLIALLIIVIGRNLHLAGKIDELTAKMDQEKTERIKMYETMIFYRDRTEQLETKQASIDSLLEQTKPFVEKMLNK